MLCQTGTSSFSPSSVSFFPVYNFLVQFRWLAGPHPVSSHLLYYVAVPGSSSHPLQPTYKKQKGLLGRKVIRPSNIGVPPDECTSPNSEDPQRITTSNKSPHLPANTPTATPPSTAGPMPRRRRRGWRAFHLIPIPIPPIIIIIIKDRPARHHVSQSLPGKHFNHAVAPSADDPPAVLAPHHRARALAPHNAVRRDLLRAAALLERPEPQRGVVARRHELAAVGGQGEGRDRGGVSYHIVCTLACDRDEISKLAE